MYCYIFREIIQCLSVSKGRLERRQFCGSLLPCDMQEPVRVWICIITFPKEITPEWEKKKRNRLKKLENEINVECVSLVLRYNCLFSLHIHMIKFTKIKV